MGRKGVARAEAPTSVHSWEHGRNFLRESRQSYDADVKSLAVAVLYGRDECAMQLKLTQQACGTEDNDSQVF